jgi:hypothetical protein
MTPPTDENVSGSGNKMPPRNPDVDEDDEGEPDEEPAVVREPDE